MTQGHHRHSLHNSCFTPYHSTTPLFSTRIPTCFWTFWPFTPIAYYTIWRSANISTMATTSKCRRNNEKKAYCGGEDYRTITESHSSVLYGKHRASMFCAVLLGKCLNIYLCRKLQRWKIWSITILTTVPIEGRRRTNYWKTYPSDAIRSRTI